jgi:hypothetical protein
MPAESGVLAGAIEVISRRTPFSKTFQRPDGKAHLSVGVAPMHWHDGAGWVDIDEAPITLDGGKTWTTRSTPYSLAWDAQLLELSYTSKRGGDVRVKLVALDGSPVPTVTAAPVTEGRSIRVMVVPDLEIELRVRPYGVEIFKILHSAAAPSALTWEIVEGDLSNIRFDPTNTVGRDNLHKKSAARRTEFAQQRMVEITHDRSPDDLAKHPGKKTYSVTESFTGRTRVVDSETRARSWKAEVEYPVEIDVKVSGTNVADDNDGYGLSASDYWRNVLITTQATKLGAVRFQTVNVPQGQVIDSAFLGVNVTLISGTGSATLKGQALDEAPAWPNGSAFSPKTMAATTASLAVPVPPVIGQTAYDVTAIVQEILNRAGWVANNDLRLGFTDGSAMGAAYMNWEDYNAVGTAQARLDIVYNSFLDGSCMADDRYRFRNSQFVSHTSTLGTLRGGWPDDAMDFELRDTGFDNVSRLN